MKDATTSAQRWSTALAGSGQTITDGVNRVTVAPGQLAARQKDVWLAQINAKAAKWASRVAAVPLNEWQTATITKGVPRIQAGATAALPKFTAFMTKFLPAVQASVNSLPPRGNLEANIVRMTTHVRNMSKFSMTGG